ncbi:hypothetical protein [Streptomyces noursei]|uniref:hypothetical protein n=1 Tax=Streptomyces noursei TaxID=1971 RepID=UPI00167AAA57|nr:hypothetical protein [Streptomyces noursei]MCZ1017721.1 hypothetical protein [Streptomyces noursei]GGX56665.1 hypothetical protein GCM10010341_91400 [Streptomyces noursei]
MTSPTRYSSRPIELSIDKWLLEGTPAPGCDDCATRAEKRDRALKAGDWRTAGNAARGIRHHHDGHRETP